MLTRYAERNFTWIDLASPTAGEVRSLMQEFELDPLIAEELLNPSFKPKVERRGDTIFLVLHFPALRGEGSGGPQRSEQEVDFIIGKHFLITTRYETVDPLHAFAKAFEVESVLGGHHAHGGHLFVRMARAMYQALDGECDLLARRLSDIEERVFMGQEKRMVVELSQVGRVVHDFRQALTPHHEMLQSLEPVAVRLFGPEFAYHLRDLSGTHGRVERTLGNLQGSIAELRETNNSLLSTKQNEIMKVLTIMAFVTFPLSLISSIMGMNTEYLPIVGLPGDFWIVIGGMATLMLFFFIFFKYKKWL